MFAILKFRFVINCMDNKGGTSFNDIMKSLNGKLSTTGPITPKSSKSKNKRKINFGRQSFRVKKEKISECGDRESVSSSIANKISIFIVNRKKDEMLDKRTTEDSRTKKTIGCSKTIKSVRTRKSVSVYSSYASQMSSAKKPKATSSIPFILSSSNKIKRLEDPENSLEKHAFKARQIPKTHKAPFVVYHSTKSLTSFNSPAQLKPKPPQIINNAKIMARTPYEELGKKVTELETIINDIQICSENTDLSASIN